MFQIKQRLRNAADIFEGPFKRQGQVKLCVDVRGALKKSADSKTYNLSDLRSESELSSADLLPISVRAKKDSLELTFPTHTTLRRATVWGWKTIWDGTQTANGAGTLSLAIPAQGWWNISSPSVSVDLFHAVREFAEGEAQEAFGQTLKEVAKSRTSRNLAIAAVAHVILFTLFTHTDLLKFDFLPKPSEAEQAQQQEEIAAAVQVIQAAGEEGKFSGGSLFKALTQRAENNFKASDVAANLKNLKGLLKTPTVVAQQNANAPSVNSALAMANSLKSLQGGIGIRGTGKAVVGVPGGKQVHWNSQFGTDQGGGKGALTEGQQKQLMDAFAKMQDKFRGCYETALLKFDEMSVTVSFESEITREGRIGHPKFSVSGRSTPESQESLLSCLKSVMGEAKLDSKLSGIRVKNQFIFKS